ncbi:MAG: transketolase C-terminal domain-containing protein [Polyangia bacterium]
MSVEATAGQPQPLFMSGNEAVAWGARLARPHVIAAYPITPQTVVIERLAEWVAEGKLDTEFLHVESEHSALSACMGASALGARTFTATSSQGLLYMAECLQYASGGRFPIVMMNANRALALPWNIYGDQQDSLAVLSSGWIQIYIEDAQEALDMTIQGFAIAEHAEVLTPVMLNLDGFVLTHTYEPVDVPTQADVDAFLPAFRTPSKMSLEAPTSMGFTAGPAHYTEFKVQQHRAILRAERVASEIDQEFGRRFGRSYGGAVVPYRCEGADVVLVTLGSVAGIVRETVDRLRARGVAAGMLKLRLMRPFPEREIVQALSTARFVGVLEKDVSFGHQGAVFSDVSSALAGSAARPALLNFVAGLGGRDISRGDVEQMFDQLQCATVLPPVERVRFVGVQETSNG